MSRLAFSPPSRSWSVTGGVLLASVLAGFATATAQEVGAPPLARYVPSDGLAVLIEHDGLETRPDAWKATATYRMLNETLLGKMLETVTVQLVDRSLAAAPGVPVTGKDVLNLLEHLARRGFVIGYCGSLNPPQPMAGVVVVRDAADNPIFKKLIAAIPPLNEPAAKAVKQPGRTVFIPNGIPVQWWYEKKDAVFSFVPGDGPNPVTETLDGKTASAIKNPARVALAKTEAGEVPVGRLFVDVAALPPMPPQAAQLGLDAIKRVDARWGIRGKAVSGTLALQAPRPRKGLLALLDQPAIAPGTGLNLPKGPTDSTIMAVDMVRTSDTILAMMKQQDPTSAAKVTEQINRFKQQSGLSIRDDLLAKVGPRAAIFAPGGGAAIGLMMWFAPPDLAMAIELKDAAKFAANLDKLMDYTNRELKARGSLVPAPPGTPPGADFAEFRKLKAPERGYILAVPPAVLPTPAGFRPTLIVDSVRGLLGLGGSPASARSALNAIVLTGPPAPGDRAGEFVRVQSDPSALLPGLLASIPSIVQMAAVSANQPTGPGGRRPMATPFRLEIDPDAIPEASTLRPFVFPSRYAMAADDTSIRMTADLAFPLPIPTIGSGAEVPVLIALLLPAVQAAREAARRAQCVNNFKQVGLAMHNFESANGNFPGPILGKNGKPLLSWRVAILPYIEQATLYNQFKLDEPWDSPTNRELIKFMPSVFICPSNPTLPETGMTSYRVFTSPGALFDATNPAPKLSTVTDGLSNTLMAVESSEPVIWTKPDGLPAPGPGSKHPGGFNALFADGSVRFLKLTINPEMFQSLITKAGGEVITADAY